MADEGQRPQSRLAVARARSRGRRWGFSRVLVSFVVLVTIAAAVYLVYQRMSPDAEMADEVVTVPVRVGTASSTVNAIGSTAAVSQADLAFESTGRVAEILVNVGHSVREGDALARLDTADLEIQLAQAEVSLEQARVRLEQVNEGPDAVEVAAARANYDSAVARYEELRASPTADELAGAEAAIRDAEVALANARDNLILTQKGATVSKNVRDREYEHNYYEVAYGDTLQKFQEGRASQSDLDREWGNLMTAKEKLDSARVEAELALRRAENDVVRAEESLRNARAAHQKLLEGTTPEQLRSAEASVLNAESQLAAKMAGPSATDIAAQEVAVRLAEATLRERQLALQKATLRAPFDGVIDAVNVSIGEQVSANRQVLTIVNLSRFQLDARVDEVDVVRVAVGQPAIVTLDALPDERLKARVSFVAAKAVIQQGVVSYPLILDLDPTEVPVRPGMTASAAVEVAREENVLLVPNRAIQTLGRAQAVAVMVDGEQEIKMVTTGLSNDQFTQVKDGLKEGDLVVVPGSATTMPDLLEGRGFGGVMPGIPGGVRPIR